MASKYHLLLCLVCCFLEFYLHNNGVEARNLESEKEPERLNKPSTKYDCDYFHKEHESTMNASFQPTPSRMYQSTFDTSRQNKKRCPSGTFARKGITRNDLIRAKLAADIYGRNDELFTADEPGTHYAVVRKSGIFYGAATFLSAWNPIVAGPQYTSSRMKLQNGQDSIEVGWMVNPSLYQDTRTRAFVYTKAGNKHCFNAYCDLFVPEGWNINEPYDKMSKRGGPIYVNPFFIYRDPANGDWVLKLNGIKGKRLGHWPMTNFKELRNYTTSVEWGSKVFSPQNIPSPPMGSGGSELKQSTKYDACFSNMEIMDDTFILMPVRDTITYTDTQIYHVKDEGIVSKELGHLMFYGGAGGMTGN